MSWKDFRELFAGSLAVYLGAGVGCLLLFLLGILIFNLTCR